MRANHRPAQNDAKEQILAMASRPGGMHSSDLPEFKSGYLTARCAGLVNEGLLFRAQIRVKHTRFFTDKAAAERAQSEAQREKEAALPNVQVSSRGQSFAWDAKVVFTASTKFTACPGFTPRFAAVETPFVHTANQAGRVAGKVPA